MEKIKAVWPLVRWLLVGLVVGVGLWLFARTLRDVPGLHNIPFESWYGDWRAVLLVTGLFTLFVLGFTRPRRRGEWRNAGLATAFFISPSASARAFLHSIIPRPVASRSSLTIPAVIAAIFAPKT